MKPPRVSVKRSSRSNVSDVTSTPKGVFFMASSRLILRINDQQRPPPCSMNTITTQLYPALLRQAACLLVGASSSLAMQPADLLHAAVEKICRGGPEAVIEEPAAFTGLVRTVMQRTLIDEHRR